MPETVQEMQSESRNFSRAQKSGNQRQRQLLFYHEGHEEHEEKKKPKKVIKSI